MAAETLSLRALNRATLARQLLLERASMPVVEAVDRLAGMQAQEPRHPFVGLWTRLEGFEPEALLQALRARAVVRATLMRGTLHLASASDYAALRPALAPVMEGALVAVRSRSDGLERDRVLAAARRLLDEAPRTFDELRDLLKAAFPEVDERALGYTVRMLLPLVMVPTEDPWGFPPAAAFAPADAWLGTPLADEAPPEAAVLRHLAAFGPATAADVQAWSGLTGLRAAVAGLAPRLRAFRDEHGRELLDLPDAPRPDPDTPAPARLLPDFDNLLLAHKDRTRIVADEHRGQVVTKNLRVRATFLWDGFVAGTWTTDVKKRGATLKLAPFARLPKGARAALEREGEALLRFLAPGAGAYAVEIG
jgi:hypothetical protein